MRSPFDERRQETAEKEKRTEAEASLYMKELMNSPAGLWLIRKVLDIGEPFKNPANFNNRDYYALGKRAVALRIIHLMRQYGDVGRLIDIITELPFE